MADKNDAVYDNDVPSSEEIEISMRSAITELLHAIAYPEREPAVSQTFTNEEVLFHRTEPVPLTLHQIHNQYPTSWWLTVDVEKKRDYKDFFLHARNAGLLKELRHGASFHGRLPTLQPGQKSVWVLCRRRGTFIETLRHWSVMTQGQLFHLKATKRARRNASLQSGNASQNLSNVSFLKKLLAKQKVRTPIDYEHRDFSRFDAPDNTKERRRRRKFIAYHVGHTQYEAFEVEMLAERIIMEMRKKAKGEYDFLENNCQHFVVSLIRRIAMTQREPKAVAGTRLELAQWDAGLPAFELKVWLTPAKARFFGMPIQVTSKLPKRMVPFMLTNPLSPETFLHYKGTIPTTLHKVFFEGGFQKTFRNLLSEPSLGNMRREFGQHVKGNVAFKKLDGGGLISWIALSLALGCLAQHIHNVATLSLAAAATNALRPSAIATFAASVPFLEILFHGLTAYIFIVKAFWARGSLTIRHHDLKRVKPPSYSQTSPPPPYSRGSLHGSQHEPSDDEDKAASYCSSDSDSDTGIDDERAYPFTQQFLVDTEPMPMSEGADSHDNGNGLSPLQYADPLRLEDVHAPTLSPPLSPRPETDRPPLPPRHTVV